MKFEKVYNDNNFYFGWDPSPTLIEFITKYDVKPCNVVDIGAGEGRNSFYLASKGFSIVAIEPSVVGAHKIKKYSNQMNMDISVMNTDFETAIRELSDVDFFVASTVLDQMTSDELLIAKNDILKRLTPGGYIFASVFTEDDPGYSKNPEYEISECGVTVKHYFRKNELKELFSECLVLEYGEIFFEDLTHGNPHYHGMAIIFARKV